MLFFYNQSPFLQWHFSRRIITYELGLAISQEDEKIYNTYISLINPNILGPGALLPRELVARLTALERVESGASASSAHDKFQPRLSMEDRL